MADNYLDIHAPVFSLQRLEASYTGRPACLISSGGGSSNTGIKNSISIATIENVGGKGERSQYALARALTHYTGANFVTDAKASHDCTHVVAAAGSQCLLFKLDLKQQLMLQLASCKAVDQADAKDAAVNSVDINALNSHIVSGGTDGILRLFHISNGSNLQLVSQFKAHQSPILAVKFDPTSNLILGCGSDASATVWDPTTGEAHSLPSIASTKIKHAAPARRGKKQRITTPGKFSYRAGIFSQYGLFTLESSQFGGAVIARWIRVLASSSSKYTYRSTFRTVANVEPEGTLEDTTIRHRCTDATVSNKKSDHNPVAQPKYLWVPEIWRVVDQSPLTCMCLSDNGRLLLCGQARGGILMLNADSLKQYGKVDNVHGFHLTGLAFVDNDSRVIAASPDSQLSMISSSRIGHRSNCGNGSCISCATYSFYVLFMGFAFMTILLWLVIGVAIVLGTANPHDHAAWYNQLQLGFHTFAHELLQYIESIL